MKFVKYFEINELIMEIPVITQVFAKIPDIFTSYIIRAGILVHLRDVYFKGERQI